MSNLALNAISVTVGFFFVLFGLLKIAPIISDELYRDMRKVFIRFTSVFPLSATLYWRPSPHQVRRVYGGLEIVCGLLLAACPGRVKEAANVVLLLLIFFNLYCVWQLNQGLKESSHSLVFGLLLACRMVIKLQVWHQDRKLRRQCEEYVREHLKNNGIQLNGMTTEELLAELKRKME